MNLLKIILLLAVMGIFSSVQADIFGNSSGESAFEKDLNERNFEALKDYVNNKRAENIAEEGSNRLVISGDVRFEWRNLSEKINGKQILGTGAKYPTNFVNPKTCSNQDIPYIDGTKIVGVPYADGVDIISAIPRNQFDIEFNLRFDYKSDRSWAVAHLQFDNDAGVNDNGWGCFCDPAGFDGSGEVNDICLKKAYMGYNIFSGDCGRLDVELGRRGNLYNVFDSKIQYLSRLDGLLVKYTGQWEYASEWYTKAAGFVIDERCSHFGWIAEAGLLNFGDTGFDVKYSFIYWPKNGVNSCQLISDPAGFQYRNSQLTLYYHLDPSIFCRPVEFYAAAIYNHSAKNVRQYINNAKRFRAVTLRDAEKNIVFKEDATPMKKFESFTTHDDVCKHNYPWAWYVGFIIGEVVKEGDWSLEARYEVVQANSIPDGDVAGIGNGNYLKETYTAPTRRGNVNYKGWRVEGLYALTDDISLDAKIEHSVTYDKHIIDGDNKFTCFELEAIYAF